MLAPPTPAVGHVDPCRPRDEGTARTSAFARPAPDLLHLARAFVTAYLEVEAGRRSPRQLTPLLEAAAAGGSTSGPADRAGRRHAPVARRRLVRMTGSRTGPCTFDAVAVLADPLGRHSALALRLRRRGQGWRVAVAAPPEHAGGGVVSSTAAG